MPTFDGTASASAPTLSNVSSTPSDLSPPTLAFSASTASLGFTALLLKRQRSIASGQEHQANKQST